MKAKNQILGMSSWREGVKFSSLLVSYLLRLLDTISSGLETTQKITNIHQNSMLQQQQQQPSWNHQQHQKTRKKYTGIMPITLNWCTEQNNTIRASTFKEGYLFGCHRNKSVPDRWRVSLGGWARVFTNWSEKQPVLLVVLLLLLIDDNINYIGTIRKHLVLKADRLQG